MNTSRHTGRRLGVRIAAVAIATTAGFAISAAPARAAVTFDPTCSLTASNGTGKCGFVGKGDVQFALGWNNDKLQKGAKNLTFTGEQTTVQTLTQAGSQTVTQTATQSGTQTVTQGLRRTVTETVVQTVSCDMGGGTVEQQHRTGHRDGEQTGTQTATQTSTRIGSRTGSRSLTRDGSRNGSTTSTVAYTIQYDSRDKKQVTGFFLNGLSNPVTSTPIESWGGWVFPEVDWADAGDYAFGDWSFDGEYGDATTSPWSATTPTSGITWDDEGWVKDDGSMTINPCFGPHDTPKADTVIGDPEVTDTEYGAAQNDGAAVEGDVVPGELSEGAPQSGDIVEGAVTYGATNPGPSKVYVNGIPMP